MNLWFFFCSLETHPKSVPFFLNTQSSVCVIPPAIPTKSKVNNNVTKKNNKTEISTHYLYPKFGLACIQQKKQEFHFETHS
jgi:hypothetical protein